MDLIKNFVPYNLKKELKSIMYSGGKYTCPICKFKSNNFYPIGRNFPVILEQNIIGSGVRDAGCHRCDSTDRERLVYVFLKDKLEIFNGEKSLNILHIAPEKNLTRIMLNHGFDHYRCGDLFTEGYRYPDHVEEMDITNLYLEDNTFDLVICNHVLEHVPDDKKAISELYRVLKPGGKAILQVPISKLLKETVEDYTITLPREREIAFGQSGHVRIYGQDYPHRLEGLGFKVQRINISNEYPQYGLNLLEDIFLGVK